MVVGDAILLIAKNCRMSCAGKRLLCPAAIRQISAPQAGRWRPTGSIAVAIAAEALTIMDGTGIGTLPALLRPFKHIDLLVRAITGDMTASASVSTLYSFTI